MQTSKGWSATALLNRPVRNSAGETLGRIEDIVIDPSGNIQYAVVSLNDGFGAPGRLFAVPWPLFGASPSRDWILLNMDRERLLRAPSFDRNNWPDTADPVWRRALYDYYGNDGHVVRGRTVYVERARRGKSGISLLAGVALVCMILGLAWLTFLVSTRGWDQAKQDMRSSL